MWARRWTEQEVADHLALQKRHMDRMAQNESQRLTAQRPKYGNRKVTDAKGNVHDSAKEYRHWCELQLREKAGEISNLRRQVPFALVVGNILVCQYIADFVFVEGAATIVEDCKSPQTRKLAAFRIKAKLMKAIYKLEVREV